MRYFLQSTDAIAYNVESVKEFSNDVEGFPATIVEWLARLRLMHGVPFANLVTHDEFLPQESIRFFYLNRNWTDRAVEGALSVGTITTRDRAMLRRVYDKLRDTVDSEERKVAASERAVARKLGAGEVITGFVLRSRAVSGWPGMHVRAKRRSGNNLNEIQLLRVERLSPAVLLVLMDGVPDRVELEEPRQGVQFGVRLHATNTQRRVLPIRDPGTGEFNGNEVNIPFRSGSPGVIDITTLRQRIIDEGGAGTDSVVDSAEFGFQMLRFPYLQPFGETDDDEDTVFNVTISIDEVRVIAHGNF